MIIYDPVQLWNTLPPARHLTPIPQPARHLVAGADEAATAGHGALDDLRGLRRREQLQLRHAIVRCLEVGAEPRRGRQRYFPSPKYSVRFHLVAISSRITWVIVIFVSRIYCCKSRFVSGLLVPRVQGRTCHMYDISYFYRIYNILPNSSETLEHHTSFRWAFPNDKIHPQCVQAGRICMPSDFTFYFGSIVFENLFKSI